MSQRFFHLDLPPHPDFTFTLTLILNFPLTLIFALVLYFDIDGSDGFPALKVGRACVKADLACNVELMQPVRDPHHGRRCDGGRCRMTPTGPPTALDGARVRSTAFQALVAFARRRCSRDPVIFLALVGNVCSFSAFEKPFRSSWVAGVLFSSSEATRRRGPCSIKSTI